MLTAPLVLVLFLSPQQSPPCATVEVCRAEALIAHARKDYEAFHDLAWAAFRKGRSNDPELMLLVARAQSLSGRPGDALVMLERVAAVGAVPEEVSTDEDFARVRALPRWNEVHARLLAAPTPPALSAPSKKTPEKPLLPGTDPEVPAKSELPKSVSAAREPPKSDPSKAELPKTEGPTRAPPAAERARTERPKAEPSKRERSKPDPERTEPEPKAKREPGAPLSFSTMLSPTALAYDGVSKRFLIADRRAKRIAAIDENSGQVATLVGALGALGDIQGIAIDPHQGDLWVVSSAADGDTLHRTQLISGRVLSTVRVTGTAAPIVALTFVRGTGLVVADASGILWRVTSSGRADRLLAVEYVPRALASDAAGRLYVSGGGPRLARFAIAPAVRRIDLVELTGGVLSDGPFAVAESRLLGVVPSGDGYEIRSMPLRAAAR